MGVVNGKASRTGKKLFSKAKLVGIGLVVGIVLGVMGCIFVQNHNPEDVQEDTASVVFERIVSQNEMVSVSQKYSITEKSTSKDRLFDFIDVPFTENSFWYRYVGTIKAGVNLADASFRQAGKTIYVSLGEPYILSNTPDMDESGVLEERNNVLNPIHVSDVDEFQARCFEKSEASAVEGGLLDEARDRAQENIRNMFNAALGDEYTIEFE